jgi:HD-like signal output (HDOD) protein
MLHESSSPRPASELADLASWVARYQQAEIPVLADTARTLDELRTNEDAVDANTLAGLIASDPLMTLKLLAHAATNKPRRVVTDAETVTEALVMMGIPPFFRAFGPQLTVEDLLHSHPEAMQGLHEVLLRSHRAANFALGLAIRRMDHDAAVIYEAALLHDFAEMLVWCHEPALSLVMRSQQLADPHLRSSAVQQAVLGIELADVQQALMKAWRLPELLIRISDDRHSDHPSVRNVLLAIRLARHTAKGWDNAAVPDDVRDIASLLNISVEATLPVLRELDS